MQTEITGHNIEVTPALREYAEKKLRKLQNHAAKISSVHITFNIDHVSHTVDGQLNVPGNTFHAKASSTESMYNAIDAMTDKLLRQLDKHHSKTSKHRGQTIKTDTIEDQDDKPED